MQSFRTKVISKKAGISNLIGALLLIVITLGIAGGVAAYSFGLFGSSSTNLSATITTASATFVSGTTTAITLSVKNTGTVSISALAVTSISINGVACTAITCPGVTWAPAAAISAGQSASAAFATPTIGTWTQGATDAISVTVTGASGGTYTATYSVTVH
ncbi:MAG: hypothetical protein ABSE82_07275 [Nitrososphaerales archaeon]